MTSPFTSLVRLTPLPEHRARSGARTRTSQSLQWTVAGAAEETSLTSNASPRIAARSQILTPSSRRFGLPRPSGDRPTRIRFPWRPM